MFGYGGLVLPALVPERGGFDGSDQIPGPLLVFVPNAG
jgi:hypothetical protein